MAGMKRKGGTEGGEKETIREAFKKLIKKRIFARRWVGKFLDNREGYIGDNDKIEMTIYTKIYRETCI